MTGISTRRRRLRLAGILAATAALVAGGLQATVPEAAAEPVVRYVNLGDSYSAGSGVMPTVPGSPANCAQSSRNAAHVLAAKYGYRLTDVSCGGAKTEDFFAKQQGLVDPQLDALDETADLVTFSIGGNDENLFATAIATCIAVGLGGAHPGNPCEQQHGAALLRTIRTQTYPNLVEAMQAVRDKAPNAQIGVWNYSRIVDNSTKPCPAMGVAPGDKPFLYRLQTELNDAVARAAEKAGITVIDVAAASVGHDACKPSGVRWVEPTVSTVQLVPIHPNALGEQKMAEVAAETLALS